MSFRIACLLVAMVWALPALTHAASASTRPRPALTRNGVGYVRVATWAKSDQLEVRWLERDKVLQLRAKSTTLVLRINSREATVNGISVWLCHPVLGGEKGAVYVSSPDVDYTFGPLLSAPPRRPGMKTATVCIDAGHGGSDPGNRVGAAVEKTYTLSLAQELRKQLEAAGFRVVMTRVSDTFLDLPDRPAIAARRKADLLISLHFNSGGPGNRVAQGAETFCLTLPGATSTNAEGQGRTDTKFQGNRFDSYNLLLAYQVQRSLVRNLKLADRGVRRARFAVLRDARMPAVLVEAGFMSHPSELKRIADPAFRKTVARAITGAVVEYRKLVN